MITQAVDMKYKNTVIIGDFNFPEINWETWTVNKSETHPAFHFVEGVRANFLYQHIDSFTRYREGQDCLVPCLVALTYYLLIKRRLSTTSR